MSGVDASDALLSADAFVARLRAEGVRRYHDQHPMHQLMQKARSYSSPEPL